ncbi:MAG: M23 family metallopeptidase [Bacteroidetes bacterium]|nr:M23 family metallopeptidase [Bacteroidota bacterium]
MKRVRKYFYNQDTHRFEKLELSWQVKALRILGFISAALVTSLIIVAIAFQFLDSPKEKTLRAEMRTLRDQYSALQQELNDMNNSIAELETRDNNIYRGVFESAPLPDSVRKGKQYSVIDPSKFAYTPTDELIENIRQNVDATKHRINIQQQSYDTLENLVKAKKQMLSSIPAVQPVSNKNLERVASGFGYRIDPIYKTPKMHTGLDFTAATGTPIYATGDGVISEAGFDNGGYGNHIIIDHGYGYATLYGHMVKIKSRLGQRVKRGEVIGWVGSTGKSTGPHCHYEVIKNGIKIDPVHFFFNDLSATDYERMVKISAANNQSFD